jgi:hypothetical protein
VQASLRQGCYEISHKPFIETVVMLYRKLKIKYQRIHEFTNPTVPPDIWKWVEITNLDPPLT